MTEKIVGGYLLECDYIVWVDIAQRQTTEYVQIYTKGFKNIHS